MGQITELKMMIETMGYKLGVPHAMIEAYLKQFDTETIRPEPAVSVKKSVTPDYIVCLEDGKKFKMLKRHLKAVYNLTPDQYRARWGLPADYPMTAPNYASRRSDLAKTIGLGKKRKKG